MWLLSHGDVFPCQAGHWGRLNWGEQSMSAILLAVALLPITNGDLLPTHTVNPPHKDNTTEAWHMHIHHEKKLQASGPEAYKVQ